MAFRPYPIMTIAAVLALAGLVWLGFWQLQRAEWKRGLIAEHSVRADTPSLSWELGVCPYLDGLSGRAAPPIAAASIEERVGAGALPQEGFRVFGRSVAGQAGWRRFQAVNASSCGAGSGWVLVETGFEAEEIGPAGVAAEPSDLRYMVEPWPERPAMAAVNAPESNEWYWLDADRLAASVGEVELNQIVVVAPFAGMPSFLTRTPPVRHIGYAVTWFGLAICLIIVYVLLHARTGRLSVNDRNKPGS